MKIKEINTKITKEMEEELAKKYNNYIERKAEFEKQTGLQVIKAINNYGYCIIKNISNKYILGKVYNNCISIGSGIIKEFDNLTDIEELEYHPKELKLISEFSKM